MPRHFGLSVQPRMHSRHRRCRDRALWWLIAMVVVAVSVWAMAG